MSATDHDSIAGELAAADPETVLAAIARIDADPASALGADALDALGRCLGAASKTVRRRAAGALAQLSLYDARVLALLHDLVGGGDARVRWGAAYTLGLIGDALDLRALASVADALADDDGDVRWAAAELIVRLGEQHPETVTQRMLVLARDGNLNARKMALYCLRDLEARGDDIITVAAGCCAERHTLLKLAALSLLSHTAGDGERRAAIAQKLLESDPDAAVRRCAAIALGHIGHCSDAIVDALKAAAANRFDVFLSRSAEGALRRLGVHDGTERDRSAR
jgi:HEAT repeat protein